jgi:hypothetical protein
LREGIVARALHANIETGPERHGSRPREILLEPCEQLAKGALAAEQQRMHVPRLRRPGARRWLRGQSVALQNNHLIEAVGERPAAVSPPIPAPITMACLPIRVDDIAASAVCSSRSRRPLQSSISPRADARKAQAHWAGKASQEQMARVIAKASPAEPTAQDISASATADCLPERKPVPTL